MKKITGFVCAVAAFSALAGVDLPAKGFSAGKNSNMVIVRGDDWFSKALRLTAGSESDAVAVFGRKISVKPAVYEVQAEIRGTGRAFIELHLLHQDGSVTVKRIAATDATGRYRDLEGRFDMRRFRAKNPLTAVQVVLGVEKGGSVDFDDVELEIDND